MNKKIGGCHSLPSIRALERIYILIERIVHLFIQLKLKLETGTI